MPNTLRIQSLILSEFHIKKGFSLIEVIQDQPHITESQFTIYSELILFRQQLCGRLLVTEFIDKFYLIGVPSLSVNTQQKSVYQRAKYLYAVSILVYKQKYLYELHREIYKDIAQKLGHFFKFVEQTSNAIYYNTQNREYLKYLLQKAYRHINKGQQCVLSHFSSCYTIINLNNSPYDRDKKEIKKFHVPITYLLQSEIQDIQSQFGRELLGYAKSGDFNIKKICEKTGDQKAVYKYYQKCMEMGIVFMVDMFSLENRYCLTPKIHHYVGRVDKYYENQLQTICEEVSLKKSSSSSLNGAQFIRVTPNLLLYLYFQISRKDSLKKIIDNNVELFSNINILKWIRISQILGIIERVYQKFALDEDNEGAHQYEFISEQNLRLHIVEPKFSKNYSPATIKQEHERINSLFNTHLKNMDTIDEICVSLKLSKAMLMNLLNFSNQRNLRIFYISQ